MAPNPESEGCLVGETQYHYHVRQYVSRLGAGIWWAFFPIGHSAVATSGAEVSAGDAKQSVRQRCEPVWLEPLQTACRRRTALPVDFRASSIALVATSRPVIFNSGTLREKLPEQRAFQRVQPSQTAQRTSRSSPSRAGTLPFYELEGEERRLGGMVLGYPLYFA